MSSQALVSSSGVHGTLPAHARDIATFVTMRVAGQLLGIPVLCVQDVLRGLNVTRIPLAPKEVAGSLNLRGRIVTAINMRESLALTPAETIDSDTIMSVVVHYRDELFSLMVDTVGDVTDLPLSQMEKPPANLSGRWKEVASGVYQLKGELLVIIDLQKLLKF